MTDSPQDTTITLTDDQREEIQSLVADAQRDARTIYNEVVDKQPDTNTAVDAGRHLEKAEITARTLLPDLDNLYGLLQQLKIIPADTAQDDPHNPVFDKLHRANQHGLPATITPADADYLLGILADTKPDPVRVLDYRQALLREARKSGDGTAD